MKIIVTLISDSKEDPEEEPTVVLLYVQGAQPAQALQVHSLMREIADELDQNPKSITLEHP